MGGKAVTEPEPGYFQESCQPIYSAALVAPFIALYEAGVYWLRSDIINGGDALLLNMGGPLMKWAGLEASLASLLVLVFCFIVGQISYGGSWKVRGRVYLYLIFECMVYASILFLVLGYFVQFLSGAPLRPQRQAGAEIQVVESAGLVPAASVGEAPPQVKAQTHTSPGMPRPIVQDANAQPRLPAKQTVTAPMNPNQVNPNQVNPNHVNNGQPHRPVVTPVNPKPLPKPQKPVTVAPIQQTPTVTPPPAPKPPPPAGPQKPGLLDFVLFCGAGVYEELVFRVLLLGMLMPVFVKLLHMEHAYAAAWATLLGAVLFSAFHHIGTGADGFSAPIFFQRAFAGLFFSVIYLNRSFGVAAASHSCYDIMVGLNQLV